MNYPDQQDSLAREMEVAHLFAPGKQGFIFSRVLNIVNPRSILEIGFFKGFSALAMLAQSNATLVSVDPMKNLYDANVKHDGSKENAIKLQELYGPRFQFIEKDSKLVYPDLKGRHFDMMYMDGDHWPVGVRNDFNLALDLGIDWILADDFITDVRQVYDNEFRTQYFIVALFDREDKHDGKPIPMALLRRVNPDNWRMIYG